MTYQYACNGCGMGKPLYFKRLNPSMREDEVCSNSNLVSFRFLSMGRVKRHTRTMYQQFPEVV